MEQHEDAAALETKPSWMLHVELVLLAVSACHTFALQSLSNVRFRLETMNAGSVDTQASGSTQKLRQQQEHLLSKVADAVEEAQSIAAQGESGGPATKRNTHSTLEPLTLGVRWECTSGCPAAAQAGHSTFDEVHSGAARHHGPQP